MHEIITIHGNAFLTSRSGAVLKYAEKVIAKHGLETAVYYSVYVVSSQIQFDEQGHIQLDSEIEERLQVSIQELIDTVKHTQLISI